MNTKGRTSQEDTTLDLSGPLGTPRRVQLPRQRASILSEERNGFQPGAVIGTRPQRQMVRQA